MPPGGHNQVTIDVTVPAPGAAYNGPMKTRRLSRSVAVIALIGLTAVLVAACGGGSKKPPSSSGSSGGPKGGVQAAYRYSACMRTHGVSSFQDPQVSHSGNSVKVAIRIDPAITGSPNFKSAQKACAHILPLGASNGPSAAQQHAREVAMLAFAECMRRHGFPKFPDPTARGQLTLAMITSAGIELQQPAVRPAAYACVPFTHGLLTRANINQALANPNGSDAQSGG